MCHFASFVYHPGTMAVRVAVLDEHEKTLTQLGLQDDRHGGAWREGHYLPDETIQCRTLPGVDPVTSAEAEATIRERWPTFADFILWAYGEASELPTKIDLSGYRTLKELPPLPASLTTLDCSRCTGLTALDHLPASLTTLYCSRCTGLTALDHLPASCHTFR